MGSRGHGPRTDTGRQIKPGSAAMSRERHDLGRLIPESWSSVCPSGRSIRWADGRDRAGIAQYLLRDG